MFSQAIIASTPKISSFTFVFFYNNCFELCLVERFQFLEILKLNLPFAVTI